MDTKEMNCPLCDKNDYSLIAVDNSLRIVKCKCKCNLIYVNPYLKDPEKRYWGSKERYEKEARLIFEGKKPSHRDPNYEEDVRRIKKIKPCGNFLDIGTNMGIFLRKVKGYNVYGIEPSPTLSEIAREKFGLNVATKYLHQNTFKPDFFDVVTLLDVFEHIPEPLKMLSEIKMIIKSDGLLYIKVPNAEFTLIKYWFYTKFLYRLHFSEDIFRDIFDSKEHIVHYTRDTITKMLDRGGFEVQDIKIALPVQVPIWRELVGEYYQYPTPSFIGWEAKLVRNVFYWLARFKFSFAQNMVIIAKKIRR